MALSRDPIDHADWIDAAPDRSSWLAALKVQDMWLTKGEGGDDPVEYIMDTYGDTREQAEVIVKNCRVIEE